MIELIDNIESSCENYKASAVKLLLFVKHVIVYLLKSRFGGMEPCACARTRALVCICTYSTLGVRTVTVTYQLRCPI